MILYGIMTKIAGKILLTASTLISDNIIFAMPMLTATRFVNL
ncbi:hypothetical protein RU88_GL001103 [Lactococcus raffinolactis]|nr:hypothetical protein RU88_GL001103 [Lactococcus raffinolactis]